MSAEFIERYALVEQFPHGRHVIEVNARAQPASVVNRQLGKLGALGRLRADQVGAQRLLEDRPHGGVPARGNDLRLLASGPRTGLGEINLPPMQPGSSIMPGKVNPVIPEVVMQVGAQVIGNDTAITIGGTQGNFELNVRIPLMARNLLQSIALLSSTATAFREKCVEGITPNLEGLERHAEGTLAAATALNPYIGYDLATDIVKEATKSGRPLREVAREKGVDEATLNKALNLKKIAKGGLI
mgnify:CR=1 FL=1